MGFLLDNRFSLTNACPNNSCRFGLISINMREFGAMLVGALG
jgi:hypothetical protein